MGLNAVLQGDVATKFSKKDIQRVYFVSLVKTPTL